MNVLKTTIAGLLACSSLALAANSMAYDAPKAKKAPEIDGNANDAAWALAAWRPINNLGAGKQPDSLQDYDGKFKVVWTPERVYILAEITDDVLYDGHPNPLEKYWDDDALEIFIDEDKSGGPHQFSYNAFAYHVALDNQAVDIGPSPDKEKPNFRTFNDHVKSVWKRSAKSPHTIIWEVAMDVYPDTFKDTYAKGETPAKPVLLTAGKVMGFMMAYCDNDGSKERESFPVSEDVPAVNGDKNRGYIDAGVFGALKLVE